MTSVRPFVPPSPPPTPWEPVAQRAARRFAQCFDRPPRWIVAAPGRVNLIGEHTDYNDGFVLPMAIDRYTVIAANLPADPRRPNIELQSIIAGGSAIIPLGGPFVPGEPTWANYVRGVLEGFRRKGVRTPAFDAVIDSTVPLGGGLSSSAALEVATATLLEAATGHVLEPVAKALLCQKAEQEFAGVPCGIMDQFTSVLARDGHLLLLDCRSHATEAVPLNDPSLTVLIINTNVRHELADGEYARRRAQCEAAARALRVPALRDATLTDLDAVRPRLDDPTFRRARHIITENERTLAAVAALRACDWEKLGELMYASHASLRDDYEVSCRELDAVVEIARSIGRAGGLIGCRMTGGGFGGCAVALAETAFVTTITRRITKEYEDHTSIEPTLFSSKPAGGARIVRPSPAEAPAKGEVGALLPAHLPSAAAKSRYL